MRVYCFKCLKSLKYSYRNTIFPSQPSWPSTVCLTPIPSNISRPKSTGQHHLTIISPQMSSTQTMILQSYGRVWQSRPDKSVEIARQKSTVNPVSFQQITRLFRTTIEISKNIWTKQRVLQGVNFLPICFLITKLSYLCTDCVVHACQHRHFSSSTIEIAEIVSMGFPGNAVGFYFDLILPTAAQRY